MTPDQIQVLFKDIPENEELGTQTLQQIFDVAQELKEAGSPDLQILAASIAIGSREVLWRIPLGKSGLLDFFLELLKGDNLDPDLTAFALRIIGNTCADKDENRQRVIDSGRLPELVGLLYHHTLLQFAIPVLYNICVDYEPAQIAVSKANLTKAIIDFLINPELQDRASAYLYKLAGLVAAQDIEPNLFVPQAPHVLLSRATLEASNPESTDLDSFVGLSTAALTYLSHQNFQESFLETPDSIKVFLAAFQIVIEAPRIFETEDAEERAQLNQLQATYTQTLADLSGNPLFVSLCPLDGPLVDYLLRWLSSSQHVQLQTAACLALGNLARSDASSIALVQNLSIHKPLIAILSPPDSDSSTPDLQLLHSALSFLKNLSIPPSNKSVLGSAGILGAAMLPQTWAMDTQPQIQFDGVSLARLLLVNCAPNVRRVCLPLTPTTDTQEQRTPLHELMELHRKADQDPIKMETARAVANICRVLYSSMPVGSALLPASDTATPLPEEETASLSLSAIDKFYAVHPALADTLLYLGLQTKFPVLRSELWFVLALMARSSSGASVVARFLHQRPEIVNVLVEAVNGEKAPGTQDQDAIVQENTPEEEEEPGSTPDLSALSGLGQLEPQQVDSAQAATMAKVDRENGLVLIAELLKRCPDELPTLAINKFRRVLKTGWGANC
ncbi:ARM repeat-containing protein [Annulohypoxylon maeteangense]|uniref:ARM repeat-containing protein n=1 Tax=Annulohypoxylon maeteangense TaxID=1927788 RepID=UPI002008A901|nr:ARM repeat-containing protein [Annulohypoxylon maeteangense]KAI0888507.1 ARM repeat-containing protein [Annulohypoxylon maeteangense]